SSTFRGRCRHTAMVGFRGRARDTTNSCRCFILHACYTMTTTVSLSTANFTGAWPKSITSNSSSSNNNRPSNSSNNSSSRCRLHT
ncbi:hypothetical protein EV176_006356, partial [Coemansia sp. RSA 451]